jgi:hypothetical protein
MASPDDSQDEEIKSMDKDEGDVVLTPLGEEYRDLMTGFVQAGYRGDYTEFGADPMDTMHRILSERYDQQSIAAGGFSILMGVPFPPPGFEHAPLDQAEIAGFTLRASSQMEGDEVFLHNPLEPDRRYVALVVPADGSFRVFDHGWILGREAIRIGRRSETAWGGVWIKDSALNKF